MKDAYREGDVIPSRLTSNTAKIISLSGTSSICQNPALPIRAEVQFIYNHTSKASIEIPDDYEAQPVSDLDRYDGRLLLAKSKSVSGKFIMISSFAKKPNMDIDEIANNLEKDQINLLKDGYSKNAERLKVNGLNALRFEVVGTGKGAFGREGTFLLTFIDAGNEVIYINEWCLTSGYLEAKTEFLNIVNSIKGLEGEPINDSLRTSTTKQATTPKTDPKPSSLAPVVSTASSASGSSPADKLEILNGMLKKGLITQKDYDSKKAEILKSM